MYKYIHLLLFLSCLLVESKIVSAQSAANDYPILGQKLPETVFEDVKYYSSTKVDLGKLNGKWIVLDFWTKNCAGCVASFPEVNRMVKAYKGKADYFLIGLQDQQGEIRKLYEHFRNSKSLEIPCIFDSLIFKRFDIYATPYIVVINPKGIVAAITAKLDVKALGELINGGHPTLSKAFRTHEVNPTFDGNYNDKLPMFTYNNLGTDTGYLFRSLLAKWAPGMHYKYDVMEDQPTGRFETARTDLSTLYRYAFIGGKDTWGLKDSNYYNYQYLPVLEVADPGKFVGNLATGENYYCYSLSVPHNLASKQYLMKTMQADLKNYFNYEVRIENRLSPVWIVTMTEDAKRKLKTAGGQKISTGTSTTIHCRNIPIFEIFHAMWDMDRNTPYINRTGMVENIDIDLDVPATDSESFKETLKRKGFIITKSQQKMKVLVIHDHKPNPVN